jgi:hypothetical protein
MAGYGVNATFNNISVILGYICYLDNSSPVQYQLCAGKRGEISLQYKLCAVKQGAISLVLPTIVVYKRCWIRQYEV